MAERTEAIEGAAGCAVSADSQPSNVGEGEEATEAQGEAVEMTAMGPEKSVTPGEDASANGGSTEMEADVGSSEDKMVVRHAAGVQEPAVKFVIKDITDTDKQKSRYNYSLPLSCSVTDLYSAVAKEAGYEDQSFLLAWDNQDSDNADLATPLSPKSTQTLYELGMPSEPERCTLFLRDGPDAPPIIVSNTSQQPEGAETTISTATSVSLTTSSPQLNNPTSSTTTTSWSYSNKSDTGFVGLVNQAMTCYLNSFLQTLYMTPEFRIALYSWKFNGDPGEGIKSIPYQLQRLFIHLQTSIKRAVETTDVTKSFGWDSSEAWQQHDVQELCRVMFDALEKRLRKDGHKRPELINELYQGDMKDYVECLECKNESARKDHFLDIPLVIKPFGGSKSYGSVEEALDGFVAPETLSGDNQYSCENCKRKCDARKGLKFTRFPYLLTLQLKRFDFDYSTMNRMKLNDRMTFPNVLNLNRFVDPSDMPEHDEDLDFEKEYKDFVTEKFDGSRSSYIRPTESASQSDGEEAGVATGSKLAEMLKEGPYVYELFSIMIHSGSAIGGHYYAYIKSLSDKQWYSFNDQSVTRISRHDIEQAFGGNDRTRSYYSSMYASSANAYMLMYRQVDKTANQSFPKNEELPAHILQQIKEEKEQEQRERERQEWEKHLCKFRVFMRHPSTNELVERKLEIHKDKTLREATLEAYKILGLSELVPLDRCRLVRYDEYTETLDQSFDTTQEEVTFGSHVGGARSYYSFEIFMEIRPEGSQFKVYNKGGLNLKVLVIDLPEEKVREPVQMRAEQGWTVQQLKIEIANHCGLAADVMVVAIETYQNEGKPLEPPEQTLKSEGFYNRKHTVFVCCDPKDFCRDYQSSIMNRVIDKFSNTITLLVTVPPTPARLKGKPSAQPQVNDDTANGFKDNFVDPNNANASGKGENVGGAEAVAGEQLGEGMDGSEEGENGNGQRNNQKQEVEVEDQGTSVAGEASSPVEMEEDKPAEEANSTENTNNEEEVRRDMDDVNRPLQRVITVQIDRRKNLGDLKQVLEDIVQVPAADFKIYRVYSNNQEYEIFRLQDPLQNVPNETRMIVRLGRALLPGEFRIKLSLLRVNEVEFFKSLLDSIVAKGMTVRELKHRLVKEAYEQGVEFPLKVDRMRLRKKTWRSPGTIYLDDQVFEKDIHVFANYEMFIEPLEGDDPMKHATQMQVYVRRWRPSTYSVDKTSEVILDENTPEHLKQKLSEFSGIPVERVQFAKAFGSFPCEMSVLDLESDLEWNPPVPSINSSPLAIYDDGAILYFKDSEEQVSELSTDKRTKLQKEEKIRLSGYTGSSNRVRKPELAVKIKTDDDDVTSPAASEG